MAWNRLSFNQIYGVVGAEVVHLLFRRGHDAANDVTNDVIGKVGVGRDESCQKKYFENLNVDHFAASIKASFYSIVYSTG